MTAAGRVLERLAARLPEYELRPVEGRSQDDCGALFRLMQSNPAYFAAAQDHPVAYGDAARDVTSLPPRVSAAQRCYAGVFSPAGMAAALDFLADYPDPGTVWIGFFMVGGARKRRSFGSRVIRAFFEAAREGGFARVQLECLENNAEGFAFWTAMGFRGIRRTVAREAGRPDWRIAVMERPL